MLKVSSPSSRPSRNPTAVPRSCCGWARRRKSVDVKIKMQILQFDFYESRKIRQAGLKNLSTIEGHRMGCTLTNCCRGVSRFSCQGHLLEKSVSQKRAASLPYRGAIWGDWGTPQQASARDCKYTCPACYALQRDILIEVLSFFRKCVKIMEKFPGGPCFAASAVH